jgi:hypothetical protein
VNLIRHSGLAKALLSDGPAPDRRDAMGLYGWLIGDWEMDVLRHPDDGTTHSSDGEIHFGWVLDGLAIQDVWIAPRRPAPPAMYGTTLRVYDPGIDAWHVVWSDPVKQYHSRQVGRAEGKDIVQVGIDTRGLETRWRFTEIAADSFRWLGERRSAASEAWRLEVEFFARRTG